MPYTKFEAILSTFKLCTRSPSEWENVISYQQIWNETFGVDDNYHIPCNEWTSDDEDEFNHEKYDEVH